MGNARVIYTPLPTWALRLNGAESLFISEGSGLLGVVESFNFSLAPWVAVDTPYEEIYFCGQGEEDLDGKSGWHLRGNRETGVLTLEINDGQPSKASIQSNEWAFPQGEFFVLGVDVYQAIDGKLAKLFCNGALVGSGEAAGMVGSLVNGEPLRIGAGPAGGNNLKGLLSYFRWALNRSLPQTYYEREAVEMAWGLPQKIRDFTEVWPFDQSLLGLSDTGYLLEFAGEEASYEAGYPYNLAPLQVTFQPNLNYGHEPMWEDLETEPERAEDGSLRFYDDYPAKNLYRLTFTNLSLDQMLAWQAVWASKTGFSLYEDWELPQSMRGLLSRAPEIASVPYFDRNTNEHLWDVTVEMREI